MVVGSKPLWLMRAIVRDYSRPGDVVCDPCAGGATTLIASVIEGRQAIGSELDPATHAKALNRIVTSGEIERYAPSDALKHAKQARLF
jgi:site-specific DNA-methyltransferase (adenine-specific)